MTAVKVKKTVKIPMKINVKINVKIKIKAKVKVKVDVKRNLSRFGVFVFLEPDVLWLWLVMPAQCTAIAVSGRSSE